VLRDVSPQPVPPVELALAEERDGQRQLPQHGAHAAVVRGDDDLPGGAAQLELAEDLVLLGGVAAGGLCFWRVVGRGWFFARGGRGVRETRRTEDARAVARGSNVATAATETGHSPH